MNKTKVIKILNELMTRKERTNKDKGFFFVMVFNEKVMPKEVNDILYKEGFKIDDYHYNWLSESFEAIANWLKEQKGKINLNDFEYYEYCEADCYTNQLTEWLNSRNDRVYYLTEALEETGITDGFQALAIAQSKEKEEVFRMGIEVTKYLLENE